MGVNLKDIVLKHKIELADLKGKKLAVDAFNTIYQFLATIRQRDGTPLMDKNGNITSHLSGLFYRTINLMEAGVKPCFVFDGKAPVEKQATQESRANIKIEAERKYKEAIEKGDIDGAKKYAQQTSRLTPEMIHEAKELLGAMGLPWVQAISEGEAQAAHMCRKGHVWGVVSQDYDTVLYAAPRLIRNLSITSRKKIAGTQAYKAIEIELIDLSETLNFLQVDITGLIDLALLVGTDYNPSGVQGIGPKTALKVIRAKMFDTYKDKIPAYDKLKNMFLKPAITPDYSLVWKQHDTEKIIEILCTRHGFSEERTRSTLKRLEQSDFDNKQAGLSKFM